jgi:hypothetical protein
MHAVFQAAASEVRVRRGDAMRCAVRGCGGTLRPCAALLVSLVMLADSWRRCRAFVVSTVWCAACAVPQEMSLVEDLRDVDGDFKRAQHEADAGLASALTSLDEIVGAGTLVSVLRLAHLSGLSPLTGVLYC